MAKAPVLHPYSDAESFSRLMLLIATLVQHPGIGSRQVGEVREVDAVEEILAEMRSLATTLNLTIPRYSVHTLRKDLATLRNYGILSRDRHDWGYYLGTGALNREELCLALHALTSLATHQGDPQTRRVQRQISQRLKGLDAELQGKLLYPVRQHINRTTVETDPDALIRSRKGTTLLNEIERVETAIAQGQALELVYQSGFYGKRTTKPIQVYPLQLVYHDVAWYLLCEDLSDGHFATYRMNRLKNYCEILTPEGRGIEVQKQRLAIAHQLLQNGWGLFLGDRTEQQSELAGTLPLEEVRVRFFAEVAEFILEGDRRHCKQKIRYGPKDPETGEYQYVDYFVALPGRSLREFRLWVNRYLEYAQILAPEKLAIAQAQAGERMVSRYGSSL